MSFRLSTVGVTYYINRGWYATCPNLQSLSRIAGPPANWIASVNTRQDEHTVRESSLPYHIMWEPTTPHPPSSLHKSSPENAILKCAPPNHAPRPTNSQCFRWLEWWIMKYDTFLSRKQEEEKKPPPVPAVFDSVPWNTIQEDNSPSWRG